MRKLSGLLALLGTVVIALGATAPANAATLNLENSTLAVSIGALPPITIDQSPDPISVMVSSGGGSFSEQAGIFASTVILPTALFTGVNLISSLNVSASNGTGTFTETGGLSGGFGGNGALAGLARVGVLGGALNLSVPLSVVGGGGKVVTGVAALTVTVTGHLWTSGTAVVQGITTGDPGSFVNTVTLAGYDNRTANHAGALQLVTPIRILTNAAGNLPGFAVQTLSFAPEPAGVLLLGSAAAGLVVLGRMRRRR
jgi:hypothetical protein